MKVLQEYLELTGIPQVELAKKARMSPAALNHFVSGRREPGVKNLRKLSEATGMSIDKLVGAAK